MELVEQYRLMHESGHFPGYSIRQYVDDIDALVRKTGAKTILDYGCGKGRQYADLKLHEFWKVAPTLYDPAVFPEKPEGTFHGVVCTDVLEHVPEEDLEEVLREIFAYAERFAFLSICTRKAKKTLPDGRNAHLTVKPEEWWLSLIEGLEPSVLYEVKFQ